MTGSDQNDSMNVVLDAHGVLVVHGDIDIAGGPVLEAAIEALAADQPVVIDLADVFFIDSSGLRRLLGASRRARLHGAEVTLRNVGAEVARLLQITATTDQFTIESTRASS